MNIVNQVYLNISTVGHLTNDPEATIYTNPGGIKLPKNVLKNLIKDSQQYKLIESVKDSEIVLQRNMTKGDGWFYIVNLGD